MSLSGRCRRPRYALNRATTYGTWVNLNGVCINDICGSGFESKSAPTSSSHGLADILMGAVE